MLIKIVDVPVESEGATDQPPRKCGLCGKNAEGVNPEIKIDGELMCSATCARLVLHDGQDHEFDILWHLVPTPLGNPLIIRNSKAGH